MFRYALPLAFVATPALADFEEYGHMMGYGVGMIFGPILWLLVLGLVVAGVIWLVRRFDGAAPGDGGSKSSALNELDMRLARGEIDADDYTARKKLLSN